MPAPFPAYYLVSGDGHRWGAETGAAVGSPVTVTFSFPTALAPNLQKDFSGWTKFNPVQEAATRKALAYIESFTNIKFVEVAANTGKLQFDNTNLGPGMGGQAPHAVWGGAGGIEFAHVVMNNAAGWRLDNQAYVPGEISTADTGGAAWQTLIHEIAHTLGLKHPHDLNDARDPGSIRPAATDDFTVSTMSYTAYKNAMVTATGRHADGSQYSLTNTLKPQTFGMDDIAALQYLYGTNTSSKGNNTYVFKPDQPVFMTISDNGPNNTIDVSALTGSNTIYLSGGSFSNLAIKQNLPAASVKGDTYNGTHALAIAYSAKVANVIGGSGDDAIAGNELANTLYGRNGNDQLIGGDGTDTLYGGLGADRLVGDHGFDYARYDDANYGNLIISLTDPSKNTGAAKGDTYEWVEGIVGGVGNDTITGDAGINVLRGGAGNDALNGGAGADTLEGGAGNDTFFVDNTGDKVVEGVNGGIDKVVALVTVTLAANVENLTLTGKAAINGSGNGLANVITGNAGNNLLNGAAGADTLSGGLGDDRYVVDNVGDRVVEAAKAGTDTVQASVTVTLAANVENLTLTGKAAIDGTGNALANLIVGNNGNNVLAGGLGNDSLTGGAGKDSFVFNTTLGATNIDMIKSFSAADDTIRLDDAVFKGLALGTLSANALSIGTVDVAADASDRIIYNTKTGRLFYDADGTGAQKAVAFATLDTHPSLTFQDFLVV